jgi:hypothetical protein
MSLGDQTVYIGNKRYTRRVWNLRTKGGRTWGTVKFAGRAWDVVLIGEGEYAHWATHDSE